MDRTCGAKSRAGSPCKRAPSIGKKRCNLHGGRSTGAPSNTTHAIKHGIYSSTLSKDELDQWESIQLGSVDDELKLCRLRLVRALKSEQENGEKPQLAEYVISDKTRSKTYKAKDHPLIVDRLMSRISSLEKTRALLISGGGSNQTPDAFDVEEYDD